VQCVIIGNDVCAATGAANSSARGRAASGRMASLGTCGPGGWVEPKRKARPLQRAGSR
jgi:hypothetical protein